MPALLNNISGTSGTFSTSTFNSNTGVQQGNCLVLATGSTFGGETWTISDPSNGTWGAALVTFSHFGGIQFFAFPNAAGGVYTVTATETTGGKASWGTLMEFSGLATSSGALLDQSATHFGSGSTSASVGPTPATTNSTEAVIAMFQGTTSQTWTQGGSFTLLTPATQQFACEYLITSSTGTQTGTATTLANVSYDAAIVTLLPAIVVSPDTLLGQGWV